MSSEEAPRPSGNSERGQDAQHEHHPSTRRGPTEQERAERRQRLACEIQRRLARLAKGVLPLLEDHQLSPEALERVKAIKSARQAAFRGWLRAEPDDRAKGRDRIAALDALEQHVRRGGRLNPRSDLSLDGPEVARGEQILAEFQDSHGGAA